mmetsp:Transcript_31003/g.42397  ORF Transcript_31003/g.42397 Transcript_31003/m.42397 type:complete len:249 (+) Transcript_31003:1620-2366(+)
MPELATFVTLEANLNMFDYIRFACCFCQQFDGKHSVKTEKPEGLSGLKFISQNEYSCLFNRNSLTNSGHLLVSRCPVRQGSGTSPATLMHISPGRASLCLRTPNTMPAVRVIIGTRGASGSSMFTISPSSCPSVTTSPALTRQARTPHTLASIMSTPLSGTALGTTPGPAESLTGSSVSAWLERYPLPTRKRSSAWASPSARGSYTSDSPRSSMVAASQAMGSGWEGKPSCRAAHRQEQASSKGSPPE